MNPIRFSGTAVYLPSVPTATLNRMTELTERHLHMREVMGQAFQVERPDLTLFEAAGKFPESEMKESGGRVRQLCQGDQRTLSDAVFYCEAPEAAEGLRAAMDEWDWGSELPVVMNAASREEALALYPVFTMLSQLGSQLVARLQGYLPRFAQADGKVLREADLAGSERHTPQVEQARREFDA